MRWYLYAYVFLLGGLFTWLLTRLARRVAVRLKIFDQPGQRKVHARPIPYLGGAAIFFSLLFVVFGNLLLFWMFRSSSLLPEGLARNLDGVRRVFPQIGAVFLGGLIVFVLGLLDDLKRFKSLWKFGVQVAAALIVVASGVRITAVPTDVLQVLVTVLWIVGITNAFNLLDNMDGVAAGVALIASGFFFALSAVQGQFFTALFLSAVAGVLAGFLVHNFYPAKIFLGDAGSLLIGYILGVFPVIGSYLLPAHTNYLPVFIPVLVLGVPLFDTASVIFIRIKNRKPIYIGDMNHFTHRLHALGLTHKQTCLVVYLVAICVGMGALCLLELGIVLAVVVCLQAAMIFGIITILMEVRKNGKKRVEG